MINKMLLNVFKCPENKEKLRKNLIKTIWDKQFKLVDMFKDVIGVSFFVQVNSACKLLVRTVL